MGNKRRTQEKNQTQKKGLLPLAAVIFFLAAAFFFAVKSHRRTGKKTELSQQSLSSDAGEKESVQKRKEEQTKTKEEKKLTFPPPLPEAMIKIPAGEFIMGTSEAEAKAALKLCLKKFPNCQWGWYKNETPEHKVYLDGYSMDKYEVTNAQYRECVLARKCKNLHDAKWLDNPKYNNYPVVSVDWAMAHAYCKWKGRRLPTEAEWEKAARGEKGRAYPWGAVWDDTKNNNGNYSGPLKPQMLIYPEGRGTLPAGSFKNVKSPYGLYDTAGNVWEWVSDWYDENAYKHSPAKNPEGPEKGEFKVLRGGSWRYQFPVYFRSDYRSWDAPSVIINNYGFRCASSEN